MHISITGKDDHSIVGGCRVPRKSFASKSVVSKPVGSGRHRGLCARHGQCGRLSRQCRPARGAAVAGPARPARLAGTGSDWSSGRREGRYGYAAGATGRETETRGGSAAPAANQSAGFICARYPPANQESGRQTAGDKTTDLALHRRRHLRLDDNSLETASTALNQTRRSSFCLSMIWSDPKGREAQTGSHFSGSCSSLTIQLA
jgi:hypothetical protein